MPDRCHADGDPFRTKQKRNRELWRAETYETKEPDTIEWIDSFFREGDVIYDIRANIGQYSLYAAKRLKGNCRILAFEPEALNYSKLNKGNASRINETFLKSEFMLRNADSIEYKLGIVQNFIYKRQG